MPWFSAIGASQTASAARNAAREQGKSAAEANEIYRQAMEENKRQFDMFADLIQPYVGQGSTALDEMGALMGFDKEIIERKAVEWGREAPTLSRVPEITSDQVGNLNKQVFAGGTLSLERAEDSGIGYLPREYRDEWLKGGGSFDDKSGTYRQYMDDLSEYERHRGQRNKILALAEARGIDPADLAQHPELAIEVLGKGTSEVEAARLVKEYFPYEETSQTISGEERQAEAIREIEEGPLMAEMVRQGEEGIMKNASMTGGLRGGNTQAALAQFRPAVLNTLINQKLGQLGGMASGGLSSVLGLGGGGQNYANANFAGASGASGNIIGAGNAAAQGTLAGGQAWGNFAGGVGNTATTLGMLYAFGGLGGAAGGTATTGRAGFGNWVSGGMKGGYRF